MRIGFDDIPELRDEARRQVAMLSDRWVAPIAVAAPVPWLKNELGELAFRTPDSEPETQWESLLAIDALHQVASPFSRLSASGRVFFVSVTEAPNRPTFSSTTFLWDSGFSVIDVVRPLVPVQGGLAELAVGVARRTPTRLLDHPLGAHAFANRAD